MASIAAAAEFLVDNFETGTTGGWTNASGLTGGYRSGYAMYFTDNPDIDTVGKEAYLTPLSIAGGSGSYVNCDGDTIEDLYALKVVSPETWWNEAADFDLATLEGGVDAFFANSAICVMVTLHAADFSLDAAAWSKPGMTLIVCGDSAGSAYDNAARVALGFTGEAWTSPAWQTYAWLPRDGDKTFRMILPYGASTREMFSTSATCLGITLAPHFSQAGAVGTGSGTYYIGEVSLCPEPATMALLGLGGLALIRRKR